jgi:hypothetical protein
VREKENKLTRMHNPCFWAAVRRRRMNIIISACPTSERATLVRLAWNMGNGYTVNLPCEDTPLSGGPSSTVTVSSTTIRNRSARDCSCGLLSSLMVSRASITRAAAAVSNADATFNRVRSSLCVV